MTVRKSTGRYLIMFNNFKTTGKVQVKPVLLGFIYLERFLLRGKTTIQRASVSLSTLSILSNI